jgi:peptide/nickel transport system permease protein
MLVIILVIAVFAPLLAPYDPDEMSWTPFQTPSCEHPLGTDDMGKDLYSQLLYASRISLMVGFAAATVSIAIGVTVGLVAGYMRGWVEDFLMGITDLFLLIPGFPLMILVSAYLGSGIVNIILVIAVRWWCSTARVVHSRVLQVREQSFIESTKSMGFTRPYIMLRHVLRNAKDAIVAKWSLSIASAMMAEAGMAFLGLGDPYQISWGGMISKAFNRGGFAMDLWWWYIAPGALICVCATAFFLISMREQRLSYPLEMI